MPISILLIAVFCTGTVDPSAGFAKLEYSKDCTRIAIDSRYASAPAGEADNPIQEEARLTETACTIYGQHIALGYVRDTYGAEADSFLEKHPHFRWRCRPTKNPSTAA